MKEVPIMKKLLTALCCLVTCLSCFACGKAGVLFGQTDASKQEEVTSSATLPLGSNETQDSFPLNADGNPAYALPGYVGYIELGSYPQTIAHHRAVAEMSLTTDATGYYYSTWDNEHYAKISKAKVYGKRFKFSDETLIAENETYYFKVEPIKWWVFFSGDMVGGNGNTITLIADMILDSHEFCTEYSYNILSREYFRNDNESVYANNWAYSDLRTWLNDEFKKKAFSLEEERLLLTRNTSVVTELFRSDDATEKIWVPSTVEIAAYSKLFSALSLTMQGHYASNLAQVSDYARCRDTFISIYPEYYGCGRYWTSTPGDASYRAGFAACDNHDPAGPAGESVGSSYMGVRPVICMYTSDVTALLKDVEE